MARYDITTKDQTNYSSGRSEDGDFHFQKQESNGNYYFMHTYEGDSSDGVMRSNSVNSARTVMTRRRSANTYDGDGENPKLVKLTDYKSAVFYMGTGDDGFVKIIERYNTDYTRVLNTLEYNGAEGMYPMPVLMSVIGDIAIICLFYDRNDSLTSAIFEVNIVTDVITTRQNGTIALIGSGTWEARGCKAIKIPNSNECVVIIRGKVFSLTIDTVVWSVTLNHNYQFETGSFRTCSIEFIRFSGNEAILLAVWSGSGSDGYCNFLGLNMTTSQFNKKRATPQEWYFRNIYSPEISNIDKKAVLLVFAGDDSDGFAGTYVINFSAWSLELQDITEFDTAHLSHPVLARFTDNNWGCVYSSSLNDASVIIEIEGNFSTKRPAILLMALN